MRNIMRRILFVLGLAALALYPAASWALSDSSVPTKVPVTWGSSAPGGNITCPVPIPSQIATSPGRASWTDGFPPATFQSIQSGGVPPDGRDFNGVFCQLSQWTQWFNAGGPLFFDSAFSASVGGYPKSAMLSSASTPGCFWVSTVDNNNGNPDGGAPNWVNTCTNIFSSIAANSWLGNQTNGSAAAVANSWPSCIDTGGQHLNYVLGTGVICGTSQPGGPILVIPPGNVTLDQTYCGKVVWASIPLQLINLPAASGFTQPCEITIINANSGRAIGLFGFPVGGFVAVGCGNVSGNPANCLFPLQSIVVEANGNTWRAKVMPSIWLSNGAVFWVDANAGDDVNNDGLSSTSAFRTIQHAYNISIGFAANVAQIQANCSSVQNIFVENDTWTGNYISAHKILVTGNVSNQSLCVIRGAVGTSPTVNCTDYCTVQLSGFQIDTGTPTVLVQNHSHIDASSTQIAACGVAGNPWMVVSRTGNVEWSGSNNWASAQNCNILMNASLGGTILGEGASFVVTGSINLSSGFIFQAEGTGQIQGPFNFSGSVTPGTTGKYDVNSCGVFFQAGTVYPTNASGTSTPDTCFTVKP